MGKSLTERQREYKLRLNEQGRFKEWQEKIKKPKRKQRYRARMTKTGREKLKALDRKHKQAERKRDNLKGMQEADLVSNNEVTAL